MSLPRLCRVLLSPALFVSTLLGCAHSGMGEPPSSPVYVPVFVDSTERGELGYLLSENIRLVLWEHFPARFAEDIRSDTLVVDGTVVAHEEIRAADGETEMRIEVSAMVIQDLCARHQVPPAQSVLKFRGEPFVDSPARRAALGDAARRLAVHIVRNVSPKIAAPCITPQ